MAEIIESRTETYAYQKDGIVYLPHYRNSIFYVGPGYPRYNRHLYTANELMSAGASRHVAFLWPRSLFGQIDEENP